MTAAKTRFGVLLLTLATACATTGGAGGGASERYYQADTKLPPQAQLERQLDDAERGKYHDASTYYQRGRQAADSGNMDQARAEYATAADMYAQFVEQFTQSEWRMPIRNLAAELYVQAGQYEKAAVQADKIIADPQAKDRSKALGARLAAMAWLNAANTKVKAGQLEGIKLANADQRRGEKLNPRVPPGEWKRFVEASDTYVANMAADPEASKPAAERRGIAPAQLALIAAEVEYAFDNMEDAQRRFDAILKTFPKDADVLADAVPLYLQTYLYLGDEAGYQAAVTRVRADVQARLADPKAEPKAKESYQKVLDALGRAEAGAQFAAAQKLLDAGKPAEAAQAFEKVAADPKGGDVSNALHNAAVAWDKADQPDKAAEIRQRIVTEYADSKVAPNNALLLAVYRSKQGDHADAAKLYESFLQKWPDSPNRCVALQNVASELDVAKKPVDAAARYVAFGKDEQCAKADPNTAARALYRAGRLFQDAKQKAKAKDAYASALGVPNVTDTVAKSQVNDAKERIKKL